MEGDRKGGVRLSRPGHTAPAGTHKIRNGKGGPSGRDLWEAEWAGPHDGTRGGVREQKLRVTHTFVSLGYQVDDGILY